MGRFDFFQKPSAAKLTRQIEAMLLELIPPAVARARGKGPYYCLLLCYCAEDFPAGWPPFLLLGSQAERQRIVQRGQNVSYFLWAPDELRNQGEFEIPLHRDQPLNDACTQHARLMSASDDYSSALGVLRSVATTLNQQDWARIIDVTPDFVVAAVDNTGEVDPAADIQAVILAAKFQSLRQRGLV
jgi:hypothetical protein